MNNWEEKRREEVGIAWENYCIEKEKRQKDGRAIDIAIFHFLDKIFSQEKEMIREAMLELWNEALQIEPDIEEGWLYIPLLSGKELINKILKDRGVKEI